MIVLIPMYCLDRMMVKLQRVVSRKERAPMASPLYTLSSATKRVKPLWHAWVVYKGDRLSNPKEQCELERIRHNSERR